MAIQYLDSAPTTGSTIQYLDDGSSAPVTGTGLQGLASKAEKVLRFIDQPGATLRGEPPPQVNDLDSENAITDIGKMFSKAGEFVTDKLGKKGNPYVAATGGLLTEALGNPLNTAVAAAPIERMSLPTQDMATEAAQNFGRRALGYTKPMLKKPGALERANNTAQTMLDENVITSPIRHPFTSGPKSMLGRAEDLSDTSGSAIGKTMSDLSSNGIPSIDTNQVGVEALNQLRSPYSGGAYDTQNAIANEIADTIGAHGNGPISFESAQALKQKLGDLANFNKNTDALKANMYQRAYGIVNDALEKSVASATQSDPAALSDYLANKNKYGASLQAQRALQNRVSSEAGNRNISLTDMVAGGAEVAAGNPMGAMKLLAIKHLIESSGDAFAAKLADSLAKSGVAPASIKAALIGYLNNKAMQQGTPQQGQNQ